jgi:transaldolase
MLEYGIKTITTNPTLITKANEIIKLVDTRTKNVRAYVLPPSYASYIEKIDKEIRYKKWAKDKKALLKKAKQEDETIDDFSKSGMEAIEEYLKDS